MMESRKADFSWADWWAAVINLPADPDVEPNTRRTLIRRYLELLRTTTWRLIPGDERTFPMRLMPPTPTYAEVGVADRLAGASGTDRVCREIDLLAGARDVARRLIVPLLEGQVVVSDPLQPYLYFQSSWQLVDGVVRNSGTKE